MPDREELLVKVACMYYLEDQSQEEIAAAIGTSRSNVSRLLKSARQQGIVQMRVAQVRARDDELEVLLRTTFDLVDARVLAVGADREAVPGNVGALAAEWLGEHLKDGQRLALSWGTALQAMVAAVDVSRSFDVEVTQLVGGLSASASAVTGEELVRLLARQLGGTFRVLHAPAVFSSAETLRGLLAEPLVVEPLELARASDIACVGIGAVGLGSSALILEMMGLTATERAHFDEASPVGDVCGRYFDLSGNEVGVELHDRILAVELDELHRIPLVLGVASGIDKARGLLGALHGGYLDVVTCDQMLAQQVLRLQSNAVHDGPPLSKEDHAAPRS